MEVTVDLPSTEGEGEGEKAVIVLPSLGEDGAKQARRRPSGHRFLTVAVKRAICEFKQKTPDASTKQVQDFARQRFGIKHLPRSTVHTILGDREKYLNFDDSVMDANKTLRLRKGRCEKMENVLYAWYKKAKATGVHISDAQIVAVARHLGQKLDVPENFAYSNGWLSNWKVRKGIHKVPPKRKRSKATPSSRSSRISSPYFLPPSPNEPDENQPENVESKSDRSGLVPGVPVESFTSYPTVSSRSQGLDNISVTFIKEPGNIPSSAAGSSSGATSSSAELVDTLANVKLLAEQALGAATLEKQFVTQLVPQAFHMACEEPETESSDSGDDFNSSSANDSESTDDLGDADNVNSDGESRAHTPDACDVLPGDEPPAKKLKADIPTIKIFKTPSTSNSSGTSKE